MQFSFKQFQQTKASLIAQFLRLPIPLSESDKNASLPQSSMNMNSHQNNNNNRNLVYREEEQLTLYGKASVNVQDVVEKDKRRECQYRKIIDFLRNGKRQKKGKAGLIGKVVFDKGQKQNLKNRENKGGMVRASTARGLSMPKSLFNQLKQTEKTGMNITNRLTKDDTIFSKENPLFLTSLPTSCSPFSVPSSIPVPTPSQDHPLLPLHIQILHESAQTEALHSQIHSLQASINYYKNLNNQLEEDIVREDKKYQRVVHAMHTKQSQINVVEGGMKSFKDKFYGMDTFFHKSVKNLSKQRSIQLQKCQQIADDLIQQILTIKHMKQKILEQHELIHKLQQKSKYKNKKIEENKNMYKYADILMKLGQIVDIVRKGQGNAQGKGRKQRELDKETKEYWMGGIEEIRRIINGNAEERKEKERDKEWNIAKIPANKKDYVSINKNIKTAKNQNSQITQKSRIKLKPYISINNNLQQIQNSSAPPPQTQPINFFNLTKQILKIYYKMVKDSSKLTQIYSYKLTQSQQLKTILCTLSLPSAPESSPSPSPLASPPSHPFQPALNVLTSTLVSLHQRMHYSLKKQLFLLNSIISRWLKHDNTPSSFLSNILNIYLSLNFPEQPSSYPQLQKFFHNYTHYQPYLDLLFTSPVTASVSGQILQHFFYRIIKTKIKLSEDRQKEKGKQMKGHVNTHLLWALAVKEIYGKMIKEMGERVKKMGEILVEIGKYGGKFQIFVVNVWEEQGKANEDNRDSRIRESDYKNLAIRDSRIRDISNQNQALKYQQPQIYHQNPTQHHKPPLKFPSHFPSPCLPCVPQCQPHPDTSYLDSQNYSSSSSIAVEQNPLSLLAPQQSTKNKQCQQQSNAIAIVQYILSYQDEINRIKGNVRIGKYRDGLKIQREGTEGRADGWD